MNPWNMEIERRLQTLEDYYRGTPSEQPKAASLESLGQKIEHLIAYFERRDRENAKRAEKLEKKLATEFNPWDQSAQLERSSYFFSGKSEAYANAAQKIREILRIDGNDGYKYVEDDPRGDPRGGGCRMEYDKWSDKAFTNRQIKPMLGKHCEDPRVQHSSDR